MSWTRASWEALLLDLFRQSAQIRPFGVKNLSARFLSHLVHFRVLALPDTWVANQLTLQKKKLGLGERDLEPDEELKETHLLPRRPALIQDQRLVSALEEVHQGLAEGLGVQPARIRDPEEDDRSVTRDLLLKTEPIALVSLLCSHNSSLPYVEVANQLWERM